MDVLRDHETRGAMVDRANFVRYELKRPLDSTTDSEHGDKRVCPDVEGARKIFVDALNDISEEIAFALKCIDRSAGYETSTPSHLIIRRTIWSHCAP
jgi:hypothetical protein